jgi:large repetitive protein
LHSHACMRRGVLLPYVEQGDFAVGSNNTLSQNDGSYFLQFPPAALNYNISVSATGFQTNNTNMPLQPGQTITHNIELSPVAPLPAGSVSGLVTASNTGMGIANAFVELTPGNHSANTNPMGNYSIINVPAGNYTLTASAPGFDSNQHLITINPNSNTTDNITLNPLP